MLLCGACNNNEAFTTSVENKLTFATDTISLDTVFSNVPSSMKSFWIYNQSGSGIRCTNVALENGNQTGFRVNVDGTYLGNDNGYQTSNVEIRSNDSIRVFVELTSNYTNTSAPEKVEDNIVFTLESGEQQQVNLNAYSWDAVSLRNIVVTKDSTITSEKPVIVYGGITINEGATLTLAQGTTLYFHSGAGIDVYGKLISAGSANQNVTLRGDRLDNMFDYLPYDGVSGQWNGLRLHTSSYNNQISYTDIHGTFDGIAIDSADVNIPKLTLESSTVHNCQGYGINSNNSTLIINNSQITNTLNDCLFVNGGKADINNCTLAQFYPFDSNEGVAFRFSNQNNPIIKMNCINTLITGYADDVLMAEGTYDESTFNYMFDHCLIRTPKVETEDSVHLTNIVYEDVNDTTVAGAKNFANIDTQNLIYNFHLTDVSLARDKANPATAMPTDRNGILRDDKPDIGAYEYKE